MPVVAAEPEDEPVANGLVRGSDDVGENAVVAVAPKEKLKLLLALALALLPEMGKGSDTA